MFFFGHLGIGSKLAAPWGKGLPRGAILIGTVLPDLIDKPLYYGVSFWTGRHGAELGMLSGTRLFGHTALFLGALCVAAAARRSRLLAALAIGVATHLLLDNVFDTVLHDPSHSALVAMVWPWFGWHFPVIPYTTLGAHLSKAVEPHILGGEIVGAAILSWDYWKARHSRQLMTERRRPRFLPRRKRRRPRAPG